jgi:hypothetical protein
MTSEVFTLVKFTFVKVPKKQKKTVSPSLTQVYITYSFQTEHDSLAEKYQNIFLNSIIRYNKYIYKLPYFRKRQSQRNTHGI